MENQKTIHQSVNEVYAPVFTQKPRYIILMGGRGAGRSTVASQLALAKLCSPEYYRCAIMRYILGDIRNSIYREITDRAEEQGIKEGLDIADNAMTIQYGQNTINAVGFRKSSGDQKAKLKSLANYNCVIIEEADEIPEEDFMQLDDSLRTIKGDITIILLLNPPPKSHWIVNRWFDCLPSEANGFYIPKLKPGVDDVLFIWTDYKVNIKNISEQIVFNYEQYKLTKPDHYWNMVRGYVPEVVRGKIYKDWRVIDEVPHEARLEFYGLDFGYHPDPSAIVAIYYHNGGYILDEICYQTDLKNRQLATILNNYPKAPVVADSAEPKSIDELKEAGIDVMPCVKGVDSIRFGIKKVQGLRISVTRRSRNILKEYEEYHWLIDKDGNEHETPDPKCSDHILDAIRYGLTMLIPNDPIVEVHKMRRVEENRRELVSSSQKDAGL
jgi:phage terminase large subunit